jgi:hypothetical protein
MRSFGFLPLKNWKSLENGRIKPCETHKAQELSLKNVINYRLTLITEVENLMSPGQDGGRAGRGVDRNQLKLDWVTSEAQRLKGRIFRLDIDFKNAFNAMGQSALWAILRAYNIPDVDLLESRSKSSITGPQRV